MSLNKFFAVLTAVTALSTATAFADPPRDDRHMEKHDSMQGPHRDSMQGPQHDSMQGPRGHDGDAMRGRDKHDRYWRPEYRGFVPRDRIFGELRRHHYMRFDGDPYWYQGRYVVRSFDRSGRRVFIEVNPYTGGFIGVVRF